MGIYAWLMFFVCLHLKESESEVSSWTYASPPTVKGLLNSCLVIPCSFNYPDEGNKHESIGIWYNPDGIIFHSNNPQMVQQSYQNRLELVGDLKGKNCSLKIDPLQEIDKGPFNFRIELTNYEKYTYKNKISISVISEPNPIQFSVTDVIKEGQNVSASCSVSHSCPTSPPEFNWSHSGEVISQTEQVVDAEWKETSILSFRLTHVDHNKPLKCSVTYKGGKNVETSRVLQVKHAPVNVNVEYKVNVQEGETVDLTCSSEAFPPVSRYEWHNETGAEIYQGNLYIVSKVSRKIGAMYCTAINGEGQKVSRPVHLNVLYAPEIKAESSCSLEGNWLKCECTVDSNPVSTVIFKHANTTLPKATRGKNGAYTVKVLWKDIEPSKLVQCWASNTLGSAKLQLSLSRDGMMLYIVIAAGAGGILVMILSIMVVFKKW